MWRCDSDLACYFQPLTECGKQKPEARYQHRFKEVGRRDIGW
jgi:hypothetical protein